MKPNKKTAGRQTLVLLSHGISSVEHVMQSHGNRASMTRYVCAFFFDSLRVCPKRPPYRESSADPPSATQRVTFNTCTQSVTKLETSNNIPFKFYKQLSSIARRTCRHVGIKARAKRARDSSIYIYTFHLDQI